MRSSNSAELLTAGIGPTLPTPPRQAHPGLLLCCTPCPKRAKRMLPRRYLQRKKVYAQAALASWALASWKIFLKISRRLCGAVPSVRVKEAP